MCGIAGIISQNNKVNQDRLLRMGNAMSHRGPDDSGTYVKDHIGFVFRRLSIIDLSGGHQPMCNEDGTIWVVFNGEIYNYKALQKELEQKGHVFKSSCDTEVIIHLYEEDGIDCVKKLNGMFAFAIWDENKKELFLSRDRLGVKPLYYSMTNQAFVFASEIKSILESNEIEAECNKERIPEYLIFRFLSGEETLFKGIFNLLPGHSLIFKESRYVIRKFWDIESQPVEDVVHEDDYLERLSSLLQDSVRLRLRSDVPLGTFCSGGIDSSLVTALAASKVKFQLNTFSVGFEEAEYDESVYARLVSKKFGTKHHELIVGNVEFADVLPKMIWYHDEPLNHPNSVQIFLISRQAKNFVTVVLTGEGADEILGGYPRYFIPSLALSYHNLPGMLKGPVRSLLRLFKSPRVHKLREALNRDLREVATYNSSFVDRRFVDEMWIQGKGRDLSGRVLNVKGENWSKKNFLEKFFFLELKTYLVSILNRQDKMSMAAGIESRVPFLDYRLVEFCSTIPYQLKLKGLENKYLLKRLAERYLPREVVHRKKSGFGVPIGAWLQDPKGMGRYLDLLQGAKFKERGYFNQKDIDRIISSHLSGKENDSDFLWALVNLELWHQLFIDKSSSGRPAA